MSRGKIRLIILIPVLNECKNIQFVYNDLLSCLKDRVEWTCIFIDNGSVDQTSETIEALSRCDKRVVLLKSHKVGLGVAYATAIDYLSKQPEDFDYILTMDGDGTHKAKYINRMLEVAQPDKIVVGSRFKRGGGLASSVKSWRRVTGSLSSFYLSLIYRGKLHTKDCSGGFRLYPRKAFRILQNIELINYPNFTFQVACLYWLRKSGMDVVEVPVILYNRIHGISKMRAFHYAKDLIFFSFKHRMF